MTSDEIAGQHGMRDHLDRGMPAADRAPSVHAVLAEAATHPFKGPNDTDASMLLAAAQRLEGGYEPGGSHTKLTVARVLRVVAGLLDERPADLPVATDSTTARSAAAALVSEVDRLVERYADRPREAHKLPGALRLVLNTYRRASDAPAPEPSDRAGLTELEEPTLEALGPVFRAQDRVIEAVEAMQDAFQEALANIRRLVEEARDDARDGSDHG